MLTPAQFSVIDQHLRETILLSNEELILELVDHYTTALDEKMAEDLSFETAMTLLDNGFGNQQGFFALEKEYVKARNRAAWWTALQILSTYKRLPRLAGLLCFIGIVYYLLDRFGQSALMSLGTFAIFLYIIIGWPFFEWPSNNTMKYDWENRPYWFYQRRRAGADWLSSIVLGVGLTIPLWLNLSFFSSTFTRSLDISYPIVNTIGITLSLLCFTVIAELTYQQNPLLKRFT